MLQMKIFLLPDGLKVLTCQYPLLKSRVGKYFARPNSSIVDTGRHLLLLRHWVFNSQHKIFRNCLSFVRGLNGVPITFTRFDDPISQHIFQLSFYLLSFRLRGAVWLLSNRVGSRSLDLMSVIGRNAQTTIRSRKDVSIVWNQLDGLSSLIIPE